MWPRIASARRASSPAAGCPTPRRPPPRPRPGAAPPARRRPAPGTRSCARRRDGPSAGSDARQIAHRPRVVPPHAVRELAEPCRRALEQVRARREVAVHRPQRDAGRLRHLGVRDGVRVVVLQQLLERAHDQVAREVDLLVAQRGPALMVTAHRPALSIADKTLDLMTCSMSFMTVSCHERRENALEGRGRDVPRARSPGLRVVDMADEKGEMCGRFLADLGADVIRVEPPGGARSRRLPPFHGARASPSPSATRTSAA